MKRHLPSLTAPFLAACLAACLAAGCAPPGRLVPVERIVNRVSAEARLTAAPARSRSAWTAVDVEVRWYRPDVRAEAAKSRTAPAAAQPAGAAGLARGATRAQPAGGTGSTEVAKAVTQTRQLKGQVAIGRAKGKGVVRRHKSEVNVKQRKGQVVLNTLQARLRVTKTPGQSDVLPHESITYVVTVTNLSELPVTDIVVTDKYPPELRLVRVSRFKSRNRPARRARRGVVTVSLPMTLSVGQSVYFEITFRLTDKARQALQETPES